jgi:tetratricopeptide (TPR) repeat protein
MYTLATPMKAVRGRGGRLAATLSIGRQLLALFALLSLTVDAQGAAARFQARANEQSPAASPLQAAARALNAGRFEQVDTLLRNNHDPQAIALRARADIQRGRYAEAEKILAAATAEAPASDAALELGLLQWRLGRRDAASTTLEGVLTRAEAETAADYVRSGIAARALGQFEDANAYFREAAALSPDDVGMNTAWGELFLEKYNKQDAARSFQAALRIDAEWVPARLGLARTVVDENPPMARTLVERALATNPNSVPAHLLMAELALDDGKRAEARASIQKALTINPQSLEARALTAAIEFLEGHGDVFLATVGEVLKVNPLYGEVYRVAGDHAARNYRFDEAAELTRRAIAVDRENPRAWAELGMHLLRTGDEPGARRALETAFKADPYDVVTYNLLSLLDTLEKFETITDGAIVMKLHKDEAPILREYAMPLAKQALDTLSRRYEFRPRGPILIEIFPKHDDFAVRNVGLPGMIGALGACFGRVVTMDSPKARPPGTFNWGVTLWHEIAHVITLQMSNNRVPRWLTEGISVFEEKRARPEWGREMEVTFAEALDQGKILSVKELNSGFSDPRMISLAYYEASLLVDYLVTVHGEPALRRLLRAYGQGLENEAALKEAYGTSIADLQAGFDQYLERNFGRLRRALQAPELPAQGATSDQLKQLAEANPESYPLHVKLGQALHRDGDAVGAIRALERAATLVPSATGPDSPHALIAQIAEEKGDTARAIQALEALAKVDHQDVETARRLAAMVAPLGDAARSAQAYERVVALDPFDGMAQTSLGRLALQRNDGTGAVRAFKVALAASPADRAAAHFDLAEAYVLSGELPEAKRQALYALEIAPSFEKAQELLLKLVDGQPQ